jgi:hypothetical protein
MLGRTPQSGGSPPARFSDRLAIVFGSRIVKWPKQLNELTGPPPRHSQDEFQCLAAGQGDAGEFGQIVDRQQSAVGHHHQAADVWVARKHLAHCGQHRGCLGRVAVKHLVVDRHAIGRLHHAQQELACHRALLGHAEVAHVSTLNAVAPGADGAQVAEHPPRASGAASRQPARKGANLPPKDKLRRL